MRNRHKGAADAQIAMKRGAHGARPRGITKGSASSSSSSSCATSYGKLSFVAFCAARQAVLINRRKGLPRSEWTADRILAKAKFCNIDRRDDAVTGELLAAIDAHSHWGLREKVLQLNLETLRVNRHSF
eukprot:SAG31_NODE_3053_length_4739_cov_24.623060_6_plen_129_part_00